ncbi:MAG: helix-turn-helix domain-containing protein [Burkholderiales bacterium]|nr:helix-turn-helix domain-containing protein [Burkholderiales bacterium]
MPGRPQLIQTLKRSLRARGLTYRDLAHALGLSEPSVKRMFSRGSFSLARLEAVLAVLELDFYELARLARGSAPGADVLSLEQERALAADERLLSVFWLLQNGWRAEDILAQFTISRSALTLALGRLARLKLIDWGPRERVRLRVAQDFQWRAGGPVKKAYGRRVLQEFLAARFGGGLELLRFEARELTPESAAVLKRRLERVIVEFNELAEVDAGLPSTRRDGMALLVACRPWAFSVVNALKRRRV